MALWHAGSSLFGLIRRTSKAMSPGQSAMRRGVHGAIAGMQATRRNFGGGDQGLLYRLAPLLNTYSMVAH